MQYASDPGTVVFYVLKLKIKVHDFITQWKHDYTLQKMAKTDK